MLGIFSKVTRMVSIPNLACRALPTTIVNRLPLLQTLNFSILTPQPKPTMLLKSTSPLLNFACGMKVKGRLRRRCKGCYFVWRQERLYVMCKTHPRHKQMQVKKAEHNTWILTDATQSKVRPW